MALGNPPNGGAESIFRDMSGGTVHQPAKEEVRDWGAWVEDGLAAVDAAESLGSIIRMTGSAGTANDITAEIDPAQAQIPQTFGQRVQVPWPTTNTGPASLNGFVIKRRDGANVAAGDLLGGTRLDLVVHNTAPIVYRLMGAVAVADINGLPATISDLETADAANQMDAAEALNEAMDAGAAAAIADGKAFVAQEGVATEAAARAAGVADAMQDAAEALNEAMDAGTAAAIADGKAVIADGKAVAAQSGLAAVNKRTADIAPDDAEDAATWADPEDRLLFAVSQTGDLRLWRRTVLSDVECDWDIAVVNEHDDLLFGVRGGEMYPPVISDGSADLAALDARNQAWSRAMEAAPMSGVQLPTAAYNAVAAYGQSLSEGHETWPSLSKSPIIGALMMGDNVDSLGTTTYGVMGTLQFNPLIANTHDNVSNLTGAEEAALAPGDTNKGEPSVIGLVRGLKRAMHRRALSEDDGRNLVALNAAQGGTTVEQLSKVNTQDGIDRYAGLIDGLTKVKTLAGAAATVVPVVTYDQGEWNYRVEGGGTTKRAPYAALLNALFDDIAADVQTLTGQALPPLFAMYQTGASYTRDADADGVPGLAIGMAQLDVMLARSDTVMVGPVYAYTDKLGHFDSNGSRWFGHQKAKVLRRILEGRSWQPLRPLEVTVCGLDILIHYHVPVPPLRWAAPYVANLPTDYVTKGFRVTTADAALNLLISSVDIIGQTTVRLRMAAPPPADALVWYASLSGSGGNGNLCDSDPETASDRYEYVPERGMYASANIPDLVGKPYPLPNWSVAFCHTLSYTEF